MLLFPPDLKGGIFIVKLVVIFGLIGCAYGYFKYSQERIEQLNRENTEAVLSNEISKKTLEQMEKNTIEQNKKIKKLNDKLINSELDNDRLRKLLREHNLTKLSVKKPGLIEKRINDATKKIFADIVDITTN